MKRATTLSMTIVFVMAFVVLQAQEVKTESIKSEIKAEKKELKAERKELRKLEGTEVNELSKDAFKADFRSVSNVKWTRGDYMDEAAFTLNGYEMKAYYDSDSKLVGTLSIKAITDLPKKAQEAIKTKYKDYSVVKVIFFDDNEDNETDMVIYGIQFEDADYYFVELAKPHESIVLQVSTDGSTSVFKRM